MIYVYRLIYFIVKFFIITLKPILSSKMKLWIQLRSHTDYLKFKGTNSVWFHASSGEIEYCKSVISEIRKSSPNMTIILSYSSPSAEKLLFNIKNDVDLIFPLTWDSPSCIKKMIDHIKPQVVIFSRTDFWPEFIYQLKKNQIKMAAISMYPQFNFLNRLSYKWLLQSFDLITTVNLQKSMELSKLLGREIKTFADTRFDQVFSRLHSESRVKFSPSTHNKKRIILASTWPEDEFQLLPALSEMLKYYDQIIFCPHEIKHAENLLIHLKNYKTQLLSLIPDKTNIANEFEILIVDQIGYLADFYRFTEIAFVGGSFKKRIHSVMEPLCAHNLVFFGPYFKNNPEAVETHQLGLTISVKSTSEIINFLRAQTPDRLQKNKKIIQEYAEKQKGSSILVSQALLSLLKNFS